MIYFRIFFHVSVLRSERKVLLELFGKSIDLNNNNKHVNAKKKKIIKSKKNIQFKEPRNQFLKV